jgi:[ribosomal protein S18]-alanine N-acetyltransferase
MITIRNARGDEAEILAAIGLRAWEKAMSPIGGMDAMRENARAAFRNFTRSSWLTITVVEQGGSLAGWAAREGLDELISDFWIEPALKGRGIGRTLLQEIERQIVQQGFEVARVATHARNAEAIGFFQKNGYAVNWLSVAYSPKIDNDVQSVGLLKQLVVEAEEDAYGAGF